MNSDDARRFADFLAAITKATTEHGIQLGAYGGVEVQVTDTCVMRIDWNDETNQYVASIPSN